MIDIVFPFIINVGFFLTLLLAVCFVLKLEVGLLTLAILASRFHIHCLALYSPKCLVIDTDREVAH